MHLPARAAVVLGSLALLVGGSIPAAYGESERADVVGHVYVNDNTAGTNTIGAFDRHKNGSLTAMAGSPFSAGGAGAGAIVGSQGALQISSDGRFLLAVDAGSNEISVLRIGTGGSLEPVTGSPVASGGILPISIAIHDDLVYVANEGNGSTGSNYTGFTLSSTGMLTPLANSTFPLSATALPGDVLFNSTGTKLVGTEVGPANGPSFIDSFDVAHDGRLTPASGSPFQAQAVGPFGSQFRPTDPSELYVSNAHAGANAGSVSAYRVSSNAALSPIGGSPFADKQTASCWVEITPDGRFLFTVNTGVPSISRYQIMSNGALSLLGSTVFNDPTGLRPFDARLDPSGKTLYVVDAGLAMVSAFDVDGGNLSELDSSPIALPAGATPFGIVVTRTGRDDG
ncbi:MAG TPA: beta-propeller fold lactonase family protein [Chloroflexota bacterium]|nr:beta-propeller fold lactonase family protein [Chloroflexota bacterium]